MRLDNSSENKNVYIHGKNTLVVALIKHYNVAKPDKNITKENGNYQIEI